ncbi:MAG: hypothetical protein AAGG51_10025 [Cyanobacteria bacterium P01_G01_bin.54]
MMNPAEQTTLKAFVLAVAQLEPPIAPDVNAVLTTVNQDLKIQPDRALSTINHMVEHHEQLGGLFHNARQELKQHQSSQERDKFLMTQTFGPMQKMSILSTTLSPATSQSTSPTLQQQMATMKQPLCKLSTEFSEIVQSLDQQITDTKDAFWPLLRMKFLVWMGKDQLLDFSILSAIEHRPLTTKDLAYRLEVSFERVECLVQRLWQEGKIDTMESSLWQKMLPFFRSRKQPHPDTYWMLTSMGHFRLHPIISFRRMGF